MLINLNIILTVYFLFIGNITGKVIRIIDGDTIVVLTSNNEQIKIRLEGIDCPESNQDFGTQAKRATSDLCFGKQVRVVQSGTDRYGRVLARVFVPFIN